MDHAATDLNAGAKTSPDDTLDPVQISNGAAMPSRKKTSMHLVPRADAPSGFTPVMPLLPHERDETPSGPAPVQPEITQAKRDVDRGLVDTDCYTRLGKLNSRGFKR
jgi:hypothetical protein